MCAELSNTPFNCLKKVHSTSNFETVFLLFSRDSLPILTTRGQHLHLLLSVAVLAGAFGSGCEGRHLRLAWSRRVLCVCLEASGLWSPASGSPSGLPVTSVTTIVSRPWWRMRGQPTSRPTLPIPWLMAFYLQLVWLLPISTHAYARLCISPLLSWFSWIEVKCGVSYVLYVIMQSSSFYYSLIEWSFVAIGNLFFDWNTLIKKHLKRMLV